MIAPFLGLALDAIASSRRETARAIERRLLLRIAASIAGAAALCCLSAVALLLLAARMSFAEAWAVLGILYAVAGAILYGWATNRR